ncbi:MAG: S41 family peptidase [Saprospiraceae bacterium]|nr:S41 family peptidase [Saprospiraceae bacterium]
MKYLKNLLLILTFSVILTSCSKIVLQADTRNTPTQCFDMLWSTVDKNYAFFDYKKIDWQAIRTKYRPQVTDSMRQDALFRVLADMLGELKDGHVNLSGGYDRSRNWSWKDDFSDNYNPNFVYRNYLKRDFLITGSLNNQMLADSIGYIRYSSFSSSISESDLNFVMKRFENAKGIIIDVRDNGGGSMSNIFKIMSRFVESKTLVGYVQFKKGDAHNDFTDKQALFAEPKKGRKAFSKPVVVLINRGCYSATTHFAAYMSLLPNVTLVGDRAGGGGGIPISRDLPNGWQYRFSATMQTLPDGTQIEHGIDPKIEATTGAKDELEGKDSIIEKGLEVIRAETEKRKKV